MYCPMYNGVRQALFTQACCFNSGFMSYDEDAKLRFLFNDDAVVSKCAKTCLEFINIRNNVMYVCMYVCMYVFKYVCKYAQRFISLP